MLRYLCNHTHGLDQEVDNTWGNGRVDNTWGNGSDKKMGTCFRGNEWWPHAGLGMSRSIPR